jgi:hypothetical protein
MSLTKEAIGREPLSKIGARPRTFGSGEAPSSSSESVVSSAAVISEFLTSRKLVRAECAAKHSARSETDHGFWRVSPPAYKQVVESRGAERVGLSPIEICNRLFYIVACYLLSEVLGHSILVTADDGSRAAGRTPQVARSGSPLI